MESYVLLFIVSNWELGNKSDVRSNEVRNCRYMKRGKQTTMYTVISFLVKTKHLKKRRHSYPVVVVLLIAVKRESL
jgi:hypothetical protein